MAVHLTVLFGTLMSFGRIGSLIGDLGRGVNYDETRGHIKNEIQDYVRRRMARE